MERFDKFDFMACGDELIEIYILFTYMGRDGFQTVHITKEFLFCAPVDIEDIIYPECLEWAIANR